MQDMITKKEMMEFLNKSPNVNYIKVIAARCLLFNDKNEILLVREKDDLWHIPGGWIDNFESLKCGCRREMFEETGMDVTVEKLISISEGCFDNIKSFGNLTYKVEFIFLCKANSKIDHDKLKNWKDPDNNLITKRSFFSINEANKPNTSILPKFLSKKDTKNEITRDYFLKSEKIEEYFMK